jgi:outer membrane receptor protein involved in Fe transport
VRLDFTRKSHALTVLGNSRYERRFSDSRRHQITRDVNGVITSNADVERPDRERYVVGNPDLRPERAYVQEVGLAWQLKGDAQKWFGAPGFILGSALIAVPLRANV